MSTGIETWNVDPMTIGPMYPFPGSEGFWVIVGIVLWILWHVYQARLESKTHRLDHELAEKEGYLKQAMEGRPIGIRPTGD
jgi:hypothetical protein